KGAKKVYTVDVGKGQLHPLLRNDPRVIPKEEINARYLTPEMFPEKMDLITIDVSFISLKKILPVTPPLLKPEGKVLALIKPQFEVGPKLLKKGVVKDPWVHKKVVDEIWDFSISLGFLPLGVAQSPILGPKGNKEFFILLGLHT
ncbi:MAG: Hemolysin A, partial [Thermodesulfobacterium commune]